MNVVLFRIDERLIHGQVALAWTRAKDAQRIIVINDEVADNSTQQTLMDMSVPTGVKTSFLSREEAITKINNDAWGDERLLLLVQTPLEALELVEGGLKIDTINVGGVRHEGETEEKQLTKEVAATEEEMTAWRKLDERGISLEAQWTPDQSKTNLNQKLD
jgi:mannose/fructose/N-acetylgalactosamine-specific phosphotransferase system component IIB